MPLLSSLRKQGPITTGVSGCPKPSNIVFRNFRRGVLVPAFAGTTSEWIHRTDLPDGQRLRNRCPALFAKRFRFPRRANQLYDSPRPASLRGAYASSRTLGRDAVDAGGVARRAAPARTAKSCGPDAPTLASSLQVATCGRRWQESPVTEESTKETAKTIA